MFVLFLSSFVLTLGQPSCCKRGQPCWPTDDELKALNDALDPSLPRSLYWSGETDDPYPCSIPIFAEQPLYGAGKMLAPLYVESDQDRQGQCFHKGFHPEYCQITTRNNPLNGWQPAFTVWPSNASQVQTAVKFGLDHNLCLCVAGTGHELLNRHSCDQGLFIRTALLKEKSWDLLDKRGFGNAAGNVKFGSGIVFSEAHKSASDNNRALSSGWSPTVGLAGWSMGGGHGPWAPKFGLGVDNLLEVELVIANGSLVTTNANGTKLVSPDGVVTTSNSSDLFWALRGGGGSTWGVAIAYTIKAHFIPNGGFTLANVEWNGDLCDGNATLHTLIDSYLSWAQAVDENWSGLVALNPSAQNSSGSCPTTWSVSATYVYQGPYNDSIFPVIWGLLVSSSPDGATQNYTFPDSWSLLHYFSPQKIAPLPYLQPTNTSLGGVPSVLVPRDVVASGALSRQLKIPFDNCHSKSFCVRQEIYHDITGNINSPQDPTPSVNPGMRSALFHISPGVNSTGIQDYYNLGNYSYFSESAYEMDDWKTRLWEANAYQRLLKIKQSFDPKNLFWCRHCIGDGP